MIKPFSSKNYHRNAGRAGELTPCIICGKGIKNLKSAKWVNVIDGGAAFGAPDADPNAPGFMGGFPVGPNCLQRHRAELGAFICV